MAYYCGVDIGGTFTDCVIFDDDGRVIQSKTSSTPEDRAKGFLRAIEDAAGQVGLDLESFLAQTNVLLHGTTVGTNTLVQMQGAKTGLITTRGHGDALIMMRTAGRSKGLPLEQLLHVSRHRKPDPIVPRALIKEVTERVDWAGDVVAPLNLDEARQAISELLAEGVEAIAISFLWGFVNNAHELAVRRLVEEMAPDVFVTCAHELIGKPGEYERTAAAAINAYIGPTTASYVARLDKLTSERGYGRPLLIMQANGGVAPPAEVISAPLFTIGSGPVGGLTGAAFLAQQAGHPNVIATDMGGTTFDVGIIHEGQPLTSAETVINQYTFFMPRLAIESIGAGGGSIIWADETSKTLRVGPQSAQAVPGPACYGRGGTQPAVTDANVVLGYFDRKATLSGGLRLDADAAETAMKQVADRLGMGVVEAAAGAKRIVEHHMAGLIRQLSVERGLDPRDFVVYAYGGAAGLHAAGYARELGAGTVIIPGGNLASGWSALGVLSADLVHVYEHAELHSAPFDPRRVSEIFADLERRAREQLTAEGIEAENISFERLMDMRFNLQIHQVEVGVPNGPLDEQAMARQVERFIERYEQVYGEGSAFPDAGVQAGIFRVRARGAVSIPDLPRVERGGELKVGSTRQVYWPELGEWIDTAVYDGTLLPTGQAFEGPAVVEFPSTQVAVPPGDRAEIDQFGNLVITLKGVEAR